MRFIKRIKSFLLKFNNDNDLILVYTMSKVGSTTVYNSLKQKFPNKEIHHVHFLGKTWLNKFESGHNIFKNNLKTAKKINALLKKRNWNIKIITLTRDPVARDISGVFQAWQHIFDVEDISEVPAEDIVSYLLKNDFTYPSNWFETDFREFTGINIFDESFDAEKGYKTYESNLGSVLILQVEQLNTNFEEAMSAFFGKGTYALKQDNITAHRASGKLNSEVKKRLKLPESKLIKIYSSAYCKTFYESEQLEKFKAKWIK